MRGSSHLQHRTIGGGCYPETRKDSEKVELGKEAIGREYQITDDGGSVKFVGSEHETYCNSKKPAKKPFVRNRIQIGIKFT